MVRQTTYRVDGGVWCVSLRHIGQAYWIMYVEYSRWFGIAIAASLSNLWEQSPYQITNDTYVSRQCYSQTPKSAMQCVPHESFFGQNVTFLGQDT